MRTGFLRSTSDSVLNIDGLRSIYLSVQSAVHAAASKAILGSVAIELLALTKIRQADSKFIRATLLLILLHEGCLLYERTSNWQIYTTEGRRKYLIASERERFLCAADDDTRAAQALCHFLIFSGCRISEALALRGDQIDETSKTVLLRTLKRRRLTFRAVPLPLPVIDMVINVSASTALVWPVHRTTAWRWISRIMERAALDGPMACCRGARHTFAMHAAKSRVPPNLLQKWMGHASLATTSIYLDASGNDEREFAERMWQRTTEPPLDRGATE